MLKHVLVFILLSNTVSTVFGQALDEAPHGDATFDFSAAPTKVVLFVSLTSGLSGRLSSMTLYGDGKLELRVHRGQHELEAVDDLLSFEGTKKILELAVNFGLAEYDSTRLYAEQIRLSGGQYPSGGEDFPTITVLLSLENYQRGAHVLPEVEKHIRLDAPELRARAFPQISEFQGLVKLAHELTSRLEDARQKKEKVEP